MKIVVFWQNLPGISRILRDEIGRFSVSTKPSGVLLAVCSNSWWQTVVVEDLGFARSRVSCLKPWRPLTFFWRALVRLARAVSSWGGLVRKEIALAVAFFALARGPAGDSSPHPSVENAKRERHLGANGGWLWPASSGLRSGVGPLHLSDVLYVGVLYLDSVAVFEAQRRPPCLRWRAPLRLSARARSIASTTSAGSPCRRRAGA